MPISGKPQHHNRHSPLGSSEWGLDTSAAVPLALIPVCFGVLLARLIWPEQLAHGAAGYLLGMLFLAAGIESLLEIISGFIWGSPARYVRGVLLGIAALLYSFIPI
jgi:hypothetical protein